ncbi:MAG: biotin synthase BioB, partial [Deltaproteobacteria bacterium]|nr:biotin synthase BioB [Deltaproteobacteria bacterium]
MSLADTRYLELISSVEETVMAGGVVRRSEAEALIGVPDDFLTHLAAAADRIRIQFRGPVFDACSLINARSGRCSEDCSFCAQSARYETDCVTYGLRSTDEVVSAARAAREAGASRFCAVTSGGALSDQDFDSLVGSLEQVRTEVGIALDASLGFLSDQRASRLRAAGITRYNHNLETSRDHFSNICTTHTFDQRVDTVKKAQSAGFSACCGGIIGMGETPAQRLDLAFTLAELGVDCVPINILDPRPGTPLQNMIPPGPLEIIRTIAVFRLILPRATLKIAGGR